MHCLECGLRGLHVGVCRFCWHHDWNIWVIPRADDEQKVVMNRQPVQQSPKWTHSAYERSGLSSYGKINDSDAWSGRPTCTFALENTTNRLMNQVREQDPLSGDLRSGIML